MFGRFAGEEQGDAVRASLQPTIPASGWPIRRIAKLAVISRRTIRVRRRADFLIDGGVTAISAWRLSVVAESRRCLCHQCECGLIGVSGQHSERLTLSEAMDRTPYDDLADRVSHSNRVDAIEERETPRRRCVSDL